MESFTTTPEGILLITNGIDPVRRWDGFQTQIETAGVIAPTAALTIASSGSGSITGDYVAYSRFLDQYGNVSDFSPISNTITAASDASIDYTNVPIPTENKVVRRQILRNTDGQTRTFYVAVDTTDLTSTSFSESLSDDDLAASEEVPLFNSDGTLNANSHAPPPNHKAVAVPHSGYMFYLGETVYKYGSVQVEFGSTTVTGIATEWASTFPGRFIYIEGASKAYEIDSVDTEAQTLELVEPYADDTDLFATYAIRPSPAERRLMYWSEAGLPESVPVINAIGLQEDADEIIGGMAMSSFVFVLEKRHIHKWTFQFDPASDGRVFKSADRGCVNQRCFALVEDVAYMLDDGGVHVFDGGESQPISNAISEVFRPGDGGYRVNWDASNYFHAVHFPAQETVRWFVAVGSSYLPRHAIVYNYRHNKWWWEEYTRSIGASCLGAIADRAQCFIGLDAGQICALWRNGLDVADPSTGTTRGTATSSSPVSLTDSGASFSGTPGSPVAIVDGTGKGQIRVIVDETATTLEVGVPWTIQPDTSSVYQVGAIYFDWQSGRFEWYPGENNNTRKIRILFAKLGVDTIMDLRVFDDDNTEPTALQWDRNDNGVRVTKGEADMVCDLTKLNGRAQVQMDDAAEGNAEAVRHMAMELRGFANSKQVTVREVRVEGAR